MGVTSKTVEVSILNPALKEVLGPVPIPFELWPENPTLMENVAAIQFEVENTMDARHIKLVCEGMDDQCIQLWSSKHMVAGDKLVFMVGDIVSYAHSDLFCTWWV